MCIYLFMTICWINIRLGLFIYFHSNSYNYLSFIIDLIMTICWINILVFLFCNIYLFIVINFNLYIYIYIYIYIDKTDGA